MQARIYIFAVAVILLAVSGRYPGAEQWSGWWWRWGRIQAIVAVGLAPLTLVFFSQMSMSAPLANMVAVPWVGIIVVPLTLSGVSLMPLSALSDPSGAIEITVHDQDLLERYRFGLGATDFLICRKCGV